MLTSFSSAVSADCLAQTGAESIITTTVIAVVLMAFGFVLLRARVKGKRSLGALLLLGALAIGGLSVFAPAATPAQAATSGAVCVEQNSSTTPTPTPAATPLTLVFLGQEVFDTQVPLDGSDSVELNGAILGGSLAESLTICEDGAPLNCVTFDANTPANTPKTLLLTGADKKLTFTGVPQLLSVVLFGAATPTNPFDPNAPEVTEVVVSPWSTSGGFSNDSTLNFSLVGQPRT